MENSDRFQRAIAEFDLLNGRDPNHRVVEGGAVPFELFFAGKLTEWVLRLNPAPSEAALLAARCQHLCRWEIPRSDYPMGRSGYLAWRRDLKMFHADRSAEVLQKVGYDSQTIDRVRSINLKKDLRKDADVQLIEDALCLVFLQEQFDDLAAKTPEKKMARIVRKTWKKMSNRARQLAMELKSSEEAAKLLRNQSRLGEIHS